MTKKVKVEWKQEVVTEIVRVKQIVMERPIQYQDTIASTHEAGRFGATEIGDEAQEVVLVVILDTKNKINAIHRVFTGSLNTSVAHPREIFRSALLNNGAHILVYHNHPSGNTEPSEADIIFTKRMEEAGSILGIDLLDHIIISGNEWLSLREYGIL